MSNKNTVETSAHLAVRAEVGRTLLNNRRVAVTMRYLERYPSLDAIVKESARETSRVGSWVYADEIAVIAVRRTLRGHRRADGAWVDPSYDVTIDGVTRTVHTLRAIRCCVRQAFPAGRTYTRPLNTY